MRSRLALLVVLAGLWAGPLAAVTPSEMLPDPVLEARARAISQGLRCPVCQNESIDDSGATVAADLRMLVRERLLAGDSDDEVVAFIVDRYGEFVLLRPQASGLGWVLWLAGPALIAGGGLIAWRHVAGAARRREVPEPDLTEQEQAELARLMEDLR